MKSETDKRIEQLESKIEAMQKQIESLSRGLSSTPSRFEFDSMLRSQQGASLFDGLF